VPLILRALPAQIAQHSQQQTDADADEGGFYQSFPKLEPYKDQVKQFAAVWRGMNPQATYDDAVKSIGEHMTVLLGLQGAPSADNAPPATPPPATPAAVPASAAPRNPDQKPKPKSEWDEFVEDVMSEDEF
jgi:hypothetical protein